MYFLYHNGKKIYYSRSYTSKIEVVESYRLILQEQDEKSPHCYVSGGQFDVDDGSIVVDAGVAEGNFSVDNINKCRKLILVECDKRWNEALRITFHREIADGKVTIINKKLGAVSNNDTITLDELYDLFGSIDFVKMDIEGAEQDAIRGGRKLIKESKNLKMAVCTYHTPNVFQETKHLLIDDFLLHVTYGYMVLNPMFGWKPPYFRRGMIRAEKVTS